MECVWNYYETTRETVSTVTHLSLSDSVYQDERESVLDPFMSPSDDPVYL